MKKTLFTALLLFLGTFVGITFAQEIPNDGDLRTLTETGALSTMAGGCDPYGSYAFYAGSDVFFLVYSEQLKADNYAIFKSSNARKYGNIFDSNLKIPFTSSVQPKNGTADTPSNKVIVAKATGGKFTLPANYSTARNQIAGQLVTNTEYRLLRSTTPMRSYFFTNFLENKITMQASVNYSTNPNWKKACVSYYIARCGDGIIDKASGDGVTDGQGGIVTSADGFKAWHSTSIKPSEVCDDGALNGQSGKCKTDCSGIGSGETGNLTVTKTLTTEQTYSPGQNVQFRISFSNTSSQTIQNIVIEDFLPSGLEYISSEISGAPAPVYFSTGIVSGNVKIAYTGFSLTAGQNGYILINTRLTSCAAALNNVFWSATSNGGSLSGYTNKQVNCGGGTPVSITKTASQSTIQGGQMVGFTIIANNSTSSPITNIRINDMWPSCFSYVTGSSQSNPSVIPTQNGNLTQWSLASLAANQQFTIYFSGLASRDSSCAGKSYTNTGIIFYTDTEGQKQTQTTANVGISQSSQLPMTITKEITQAGAAPGDVVKYRITYKNIQSTPIVGFIVRDIWPSSLELIKATPIRTSINPLVWNFSTVTLQPNQEGSIEVWGRIKSDLQ